jgi:hypothetical protein
MTVNQTLSAIKLARRVCVGSRQAGHSTGRKSIERMLQDVDRAVNIVSLIRAVATGHTPQRSGLTIEEVIADAVELL